MTSFQDAPDKAMEDDKAMEACSIYCLFVFTLSLVRYNIT